MVYVYIIYINIYIYPSLLIGRWPCHAMGKLSKSWTWHVCCYLVRKKTLWISKSNQRSYFDLRSFQPSSDDLAAPITLTFQKYMKMHEQSLSFLPNTPGTPGFMIHHDVHVQTPNNLSESEMICRSSVKLPRSGYSPEATGPKSLNREFNLSPHGFPPSCLLPPQVRGTTFCVDQEVIFYMFSSQKLLLNL